MGFARRAALFWVVTVALHRLSTATLHTVGDSAGWALGSNVDYMDWAANKTFHVGDTIRFKYDNLTHNVVRVTHLQFRNCNTSSPISTFATGDDTFLIRRPTHWFFVCSFPGHCQAGQKVDIRVPRASNDTSGANSTLTPPRSPENPSASAPAPAPENLPAAANASAPSHSTSPAHKSSGNGGGFLVAVAVAVTVFFH